MKQISRYHPLLVTLHWVLAVLIIAELPLGFFRTRGDTLIVLIVGTGFATAIIAGLVEIVFGHSGVPLPASLMIYPTSVAHVLFALLLVGFIILHVLGVLYHQFVKKDGPFRRMSFGKRVSNPSAPTEAALPDAVRG